MKRNDRPDWFIRIAKNSDLETDAESPHSLNNLRRLSMNDSNKTAWQSKTLWASAIIAVLPLIPGVGTVASAWIAANPELFSAGLGAVFAGLRTVTKGSVSIR
jgi:hypothetical protein